MSALIQDLKFAVRRLSRTPVFALSSIAILAIGIGLNVTVFGLVDAMMLRPAPFADPETLVHIYQDSDSGTPASTAYPAYLDMAAMTETFAGVAATTSATASLETADGPQQIAVDFATASYFPVLGLTPSRGRWFDAEHDYVGAEMVAVVTDKAWRTRFGADPAVLGRTVRLNNQLVTIVGVGPPDFNGEGGAVSSDFWLSISSVAIGGPFRVANLERRQDHWYGVKARLAPGVGVERARAELQRLAARHGEQFPDLDRGRDITLFTHHQVRVHPQIDGALVAAGVGLFVVSGVVLLLACSNLANLLLVRGLARAPELAIREALGGDRARIGRPLLIEALVLSALGGAAGLLAAAWLQQIVSGIPLPPNNAFFDVRFDYRMVTFSVLAALATGFLFGLLPSRRSVKVGAAAALADAGRAQSAGRGTSVLRGTLVATQVALSVVLVAATGLLARSFVNAERVDPGVDAERIAVIGTNLLQGGVSQEEAGVVVEQILERIAAVPGVERAALTTRLPLSNGFTASTIVEGYTLPSGANAIEFPVASVSRGYFETMGMPLLAGRNFTVDDRPESPAVVILNETAARLFFGGDAVGRRLRGQDNPDEWREVVGVVADVEGHRPARATHALDVLVDRADRSRRVLGRRAHAGRSRFIARGAVAGVARRTPRVTRDPPGRLRKPSGRRARRRADYGVAHGRVCRSRALAGGSGHLRRRVVRRGAAHPRDRDSDGPWRDCAPARPDRRRRLAQARRHRRRRGARACGGRSARHAGDLVRCRTD